MSLDDIVRIWNNAAENRANIPVATLSLTDLKFTAEEIDSYGEKYEWCVFRYNNSIIIGVKDYSEGPNTCFFSLLDRESGDVLYEELGSNTALGCVTYITKLNR